jgi:hypothetical protein
MSEEKKKEYLKKNFIQPLSDNLPMSSEYFSGSNLEQCLVMSENFANYIQFDLKNITHLSQAKKEENNNFGDNMENYDQFMNNACPVEFDFEKIILNNKTEKKNPNLKCDYNVEYKINNSLLEFGEADPFAIYYRNYKKVVIHDNLEKFQRSLEPTEKEYPLYINLVTDRFDMLKKEISQENFRGVLNTPKSGGRSIKALDEIMNSTSFKNIFENNFEFNSFNTPKTPRNDDPEPVHDQMNVLPEIDFYDNLRLETLARTEKKQQDEENTRQVNAEIQASINE